MPNRTVRLRGERLTGARVDGHLMRELLTVLIEGSQRALRIRTQGRSQARGSAPAWIVAASDFTLGLSEGSTVISLEVPTLLQAAPQEFLQAQLFPEIDPDRPAFDYLTESLQAAINEDTDSKFYDASFLKFFGRLQSLFDVHGVADIEIQGVKQPLVLRRDDLEHVRSLEKQIPAPQRARVGGKLDTIRHSDGTFLLLVGNQAETVRGVAEPDIADQLAELWGGQVIVSGTVHFTAAGAIQRLEAESITSASARQIEMWQHLPTPLETPLRASLLRRPQTPRTGLNAIFGRWPGEESDDEVAAALSTLS